MDRLLLFFSCSLEGSLLSISFSITPSLDSLPVVLRWIQYISPIAYSNKALSQNEFNGLNFSVCSTRGCIKQTGAEILSQYGLDNISLWTSVGINVAIMIGLTLLGYAFFQRTSRPSEMLQMKPAVVVPIDEEKREEAAQVVVEVKE